MTLFAAAIPQPVHQLAGSMLATGIRDALLSTSFRAHMAGRLNAAPSCCSRKPTRKRGKKIEEVRAEEVARVAGLIGCILEGVAPREPAASPRSRPQAAGFGMMATLARVKASNTQELAPVMRNREKGARDRARDKARRSAEGAG